MHGCFFQLDHIIFFSHLALHHKASLYYRGTWWRRVWLSWATGRFALDTCPLYRLHIERSDENNWIRVCVDPSTPSNCDCLHLVDAGRCIGHRPRLKSLLITQTANANSLWQPPLTRRFRSHWWVHGDEGLEWFSHHVSSGKFWAGGSSAWSPATGKKMAPGVYLLSSRLRPAMCCSKDLTPKPLPFLLLRAPSSLSAAEASCFSFQSCGEPKLLLSDLYYDHRKDRKTQGWSLPSPTCSWDIPRREARRIVLPFGKQRDLCLACKLRSSGGQNVLSKWPLRLCMQFCEADAVLSPVCWACCRMGGGREPQSRYFWLSECTNPPTERQKKTCVRIRIERVLSAEIEHIHNRVSVRRDGARSSDQFSCFYYQLPLLTWTPRWGRKKELIRVRRIIAH